MMKCRGQFIFKSVKKKDGGTFTNQAGQEINYNESFEVKFDEITEEGDCIERKTKIGTNEIELFSKLSRLEQYKPAIFEFGVGFNSRGVTLKLIDVGTPKEKTSN